jgi:hypothetical protein
VFLLPAGLGQRMAFGADLCAPPAGSRSWHDSPRRGNGVAVGVAHRRRVGSGGPAVGRAATADHRASGRFGAVDDRGALRPTARNVSPGSRRQCRAIIPATYHLRSTGHYAACREAATPV